jgi:hypothetical protein
MTMMKGRRMVGTASDPLRRKEDLGNPDRWLTAKRFRTKDESDEWEKKMISQGYLKDPGGTGWEFGYTYPTPKKKEH